MNITERTRPKRAQIGKRMVEMKIYFWTNNIVPGEGNILPRHVWAQGVVRIEPNDVHGLTAKRPKHFHSLLELPKVVEDVLAEHGVRVHPTRRMKKYSV